jgi:plastocyanin
MNKKLLLLITGIIIVALAAGGAYWYWQNQDKPSSASASQEQSPNTVIIEGMAFGPDPLTIQKGTTVTWLNKDSVAHTVVETDSQTGPHSSTLSTGQTYKFTFNATGTYSYHCSIHPDMTATVIVTE